MVVRSMTFRIFHASFMCAIFKFATGVQICTRGCNFGLVNGVLRNLHLGANLLLLQIVHMNANCITSMHS